MSDRYSVYCEEEMAGFEVNSYVLTLKGALKMTNELFLEGKTEVTIVNLGDDDE
jgi:hypothetical protein